MLLNESYLLSFIKELRNAAAHNNCILNDLSPRTAMHSTNFHVAKALGMLDIPKHVHKNKMSNIRTQQIVTLLYAHKQLVTSEGVHKQACILLNDLIERMFLNISFYRENDMITSTFSFLKKVVDSWFGLKYNNDT
jgi:hypothetical protein